MKNIKRLNKKKGFTLVECVIAIAVFSILSMIIASLLNAALTAHKNNLHDTRSLREQRRLLSAAASDNATEARALNSAQSVRFNFGDIEVTYNLSAIVARAGSAAPGLDVDFTRGLQLSGLRHDTRNHVRRPSGTPEVEVSFATLSGIILDDLKFNFGAPSDTRHFFNDIVLEPHFGLVGNSVTRSAHTISSSDFRSLPNVVMFTSDSDDSPIYTGAATLYANILEIEINGTRSENVPEWVRLNYPGRGSREFVSHGGEHTRAVGVIVQNSSFAERVSFSQEAEGGTIDSITLSWPRVGEGSTREFDVFRIAILTTQPIDDIPNWLGLRDGCNFPGCLGFIIRGVCSNRDTALMCPGPLVTATPPADTD
jgi:prepilin-type N-terminal cleavage/methylation domain-containing protein